MDRIKKRKLILDVVKYVLIGNYQFRKSLEDIILRYDDDNLANAIRKSLHGSFEQSNHVGGHFATRKTIYKIFRIGYYWETIFEDTFKFVIYCNEFQHETTKLQYSSMLLNPKNIYLPTCYEGFLFHWTYKSTIIDWLHLQLDCNKLLY